MKKFKLVIFLGLLFNSMSLLASTNANMIWEKNTKDISASVSVLALTIAGGAGTLVYGLFGLTGGAVIS